MIKKFAFLHTILFEKKIKNAWIHINLRLIKSCNIFKNTYFSYSCHLNSADCRIFKLEVRILFSRQECCILIGNNFRIDIWYRSNSIMIMVTETFCLFLLRSHCKLFNCTIILFRTWISKYHRFYDRHN